MSSSSRPPDLAPCWRVVSASVCGTSHVRANQPCQDRLRWELLCGGRMLAALADGAGSASYAEAGAELAVNTAIAAFRERVSAVPVDASDEEWKGVLRSVLEVARSAVVAEAAKRDVRPRELASTLGLLLISPDLAVAAQIGDGAGLVGVIDGELVTLTKPGQGEYINETTFLTADDALESPQLEVRRGRFGRAALFSDGLQLLALKMPEAQPHTPFFSPLFRFAATVPDLAAAPKQLEAFLQSPRITERTDDDLTLLLATLAPSPGK
ncbi:MAG: PP2C family serine/threonine-protein phosphatase [Limisphaerales bacterium]